MTQLKLCILILLCIDVVMNERFGWNPRHMVIVDRSVPNQESSGYFILPIDKTAFTVDKIVWLYEFDIAKVFLYDPIKEIPVENVPVRVKFVKIANHSLTNETTKAEVVFVGRAILNSAHETTVKVLAKVPLHPGFVYEIRLKMPDKIHFMYKEYFDIKDYKINRFFGKSITVGFLQHNPIHRPPNPADNRRKVSNGLVKKLHLKYSWF